MRDSFPIGASVPSASGLVPGLVLPKFVQSEGPSDGRRFQACSGTAIDLG